MANTHLHKLSRCHFVSLLLQVRFQNVADGIRIAPERERLFITLMVHVRGLGHAVPVLDRY